MAPHSYSPQESPISGSCPQGILRRRWRVSLPALLLTVSATIRATTAQRPVVYNYKSFCVPGRNTLSRGKSMLRFMRASEIAFLLVCVLGISVAWSQTATGRIIGTETAYSALTNEQGFYQVLLLPIGMYQVSAEMQGFQKAVTKPEKLEINQSLRVDLKMAVGARTDEIVVEEGITHVETISPTLGMSVTSLQIQNMPLNGRNTLDLALLQPGVIPSTAGGTTGTFSVAGGRQDSVTYLLDGGINNNLLSNGVVLNPNPDMIEEFKILTSTYNAEYGRNAG